MDPHLTISHRRLPHWQLAGATYFITFRMHRGELTMAERLTVLSHVRAGDGRFYSLIAAVVMPDHVHLLFTPFPGFDLSRITKGIKGASARLVNAVREKRGNLWQDESFDRIVRNQAELDEKLNYIYTNPVRAELVEDPSEYPATYVNEQS
jgi:REP element-mobilizing transposase RayT